MQAKKIIVIGAGLGGLAAGLRLAHAGHRVTILEKNEQPGGKVNRLEWEGFHFDTGPTILTLPEEIYRLFRELGRDPDEYLTLRAFDPIYRAHFQDGSTFTLHADEDATEAEVRRLSPSDGPNYRRFMGRAARIWQAIEEVVFDRLFLSWRDLLKPEMLRAGLRVDPLRSMYRRVEQAFDDPRIRQLFMFQAIYVGASPRQTPATYTVIPFLEQRAGVWFPEGGLYAIVEALMRVAQELGVTVRCQTPVQTIRVSEGRAQGVELADGTFLEADIVLSNADLVHTYGDLVPEAARPHYSDARLARYEPSSSAFLLYLAVGRSYPQLVHHNIYFGRDYDAEMHALFEEGRLPEDPSWYLCAPSRTDPSLAPPGCEALYVLTLAPALGPNSPDWEAQKEALADELITRLEEEAGLTDIRAHIRWQACFTPQDFASVFNGYRGSIFGLSATRWQTAIFRPPNRSEDVRGLYLVGGSTQPGGGVPIVLISGRLVAELIGADLQAGRL